MYQAEIHSKLPTQVAEMEDVLTSDVFYFFKYTERSIFLRAFLKKLELNFSNEELDNAEFIFWPTYEDGTEPDLVVLIGDYYLLIEAKFKSGFDPGTKTRKAQLIREIEGGLLEAQNLKREFRLIAITGDNYYKKEKFSDIPRKYESLLIWINWQEVTSLILEIFERKLQIHSSDRMLAEDLYATLDKKNLRKFICLQKQFSSITPIKSYKFLFIKAETIEVRGDFIGFLNVYKSMENLSGVGSLLFYNRSKQYFQTLWKGTSLSTINVNIFYSNT